MEEPDPKIQHRLEVLTVATMWPALVFSCVGVGLVLTSIESFEIPAFAMIAFGLLLAIASIGASYAVKQLRTVGARFSGGTSYDRQRHWQNLKTSALLLNALAIIGAIVFAFDLVVRLEWVNANIDIQILDRGALILILALAASHLLAHYYSLRFPVERDMSGTRLILSLLGQVVAFLGVLLASLAIVRDDQAAGVLGFDAGGAPMILLGGHVFAAYALFASRNLPTFSILYSEERDVYHAGVKATARTRVFAPVFLAFGMLMLVFLLFVLFGVGVIDIITEVAASPIVLGSFVFIAIAIILSLGAAFSLAKDQERDLVLWKTPRNPKEKRQQTILFSSLGGGALLGLLAYFTSQGAISGIESGLWVQFFCFALMVAIGPYGFYMAHEHKRIRMLEERFPDFLRDVASSHKGGLTLTESVRVASNGEYGPLSVEIRKMADQLSWNVSFSEALIRFGDRVQTPLVERAVSLIQESDRSGGSTTDVLLAAARDAREIKSLENERRLSMSLYTIVIYITFFVFLAVAAVLYAQFVPEIVRTSEAAAELGAQGTSGIGAETLKLDQFQRFYFLAAVMQGLGDGIVAGMMGAGKAVLGLRHAFLMVLISYLTFTLFLV